MDQRRNSNSLFSSLMAADARLRELFLARPAAWYREAREKMQDIPGTNYALGCRFAEQGELRDAIFRFRLVARLQPDHPHVWYQLGCCYYRRGDYALAADALRKSLVQDPTHQDAIYMLAAANPAMVPPGLRPTRMPRAMVLSFFSGQARRYDEVEQQNGYKPGAVAEAARPYLKPAHTTLLDLGCGTGLAARAWRSGMGSITGLDLTPAMLEGARAAQGQGRALYDTLIEADIAAPVPEVADASADIVLAVNVAGYVGDAAPLLQIARRSLKPGGLFILTIEPFAGEGYALHADTGRFRHSADAIKRQAAVHGLTLSAEQPVELYPNATSHLQIYTLP